jgi:NADH-ubiquinone oxidoreductase chain 4
LGIDGLSLYFVLLTTIITPITLLSDWNIGKTYNNIRGKDEILYIKIILLLESILLTVFLCTDLIIFYISFEATLPPLFILIGYFGSGSRIRASYYLLLYTIFGSLFLLISITSIYYIVKSVNYGVVINNNLSFELQSLLFILMFISFAVKTPTFPFHIWLNLAHSEAPLGGSILLASVILKLALYGFLRIVIPMLPLATIYFSPLVYLIAVITIVWASLTTLRQIDTKRIIAYSSVGHVCVSLLAAFSNTQVGIEGSIILAISHGLVSPALFILVGGILYSRYHTRIINYYRGLITYYPLITTYFFLFTLCNCGVPLSANFIGEFLSLMGSFIMNPYATIIASSSIILSAGYSIWLWSRMCTGYFSPYLYVTGDLNRREFLILTPLLILTIILGVYPNFMINDIHYAVSNLLI